MKEITYLLVALVPAVLWIYYFHYKDKSEPEPIRLLFIAAFMGALVVIPSAYLEIFVTKTLFPNVIFGQSTVPETFYPYFVLISFATVAIVEELFKYIAIRFSVYYSDSFNEYSDGIIYMVIAALGFAAFENFLYFINFGPDVILPRTVFTPLFHASASAVMGHYMVQMKFSKTFKRNVFFAFLVSVALHLVYNLLVYDFSSSSEYIYIILAAVLLFLSAKWMFDKFKESEDIDQKCLPCGPEK